MKKDIFNDVFFIIYVIIVAIGGPILCIYAVNQGWIFKASYQEYQRQMEDWDKYCYDTYSGTATGIPNTIGYYCYKDGNYYLYTKSL